ncbi:hypothetical protein FACS1894172_02820 [Spirochaetia bacterium]|nr:hypothetical protein FACS1894164_20100 [Spirochaetia bacterium]GHU30166.1 hypothetical protein FACS1894172_02820 [Spirochaetia bacterium]
MKQYAVKTHFTFSSTFFVKAASKMQAKEYVKKHCGLVIGGNIHSTLSDEAIDWDFPVHLDKIIAGYRTVNEEGGKIE